MFYVGQEIVCVKDHSLGLVKKGDTFIVKGLVPTCCGKVSVNVGLHNEWGAMNCRTCNKIFNTKALLFNPKLFVPVDYTKAKQVTFEKITEEVPMMAN